MSDRQDDSVTSQYKPQANRESHSLDSFEIDVRMRFFSMLIHRIYDTSFFVGC